MFGGTLLHWLLLCHRYQHEVNQQLTANIPCPSVNDAAAAAAVILASCSPAGTPAAGSTTGSTATNAAAGESSSSSSDTQAASVTVSGMVGPPSNDCTGAVSAVLLALLAWADQLKTADAAGDEGSVRHVGSMGVVLDERQHGTESLLHPGLAKLQGDFTQSTHNVSRQMHLMPVEYCRTCIGQLDVCVFASWYGVARSARGALFCKVRCGAVSGGAQHLAECCCMASWVLPGCGCCRSWLQSLVPCLLANVRLIPKSFLQGRLCALPCMG